MTQEVQQLTRLLRHEKRIHHWSTAVRLVIVGGRRRHQLQTRAELRYDGTHFALLLTSFFFFFPLNKYIVISIRTAHTNFFHTISEFRN